VFQVCRQDVHNTFTFRAYTGTIIACTDDRYTYTPFRTPKRAPAADSRRRLGKTPPFLFYATVRLVLLLLP
jgi:hypothetical protein